MGLKEAFTPKTFNNLSFVVVLLWVFLGVAATVIFLEMDINEPRFHFHCDVKTDINEHYIRIKCFNQYQMRFNKLNIPPYALVMVNFLSISIVSLIYSQSVDSTVNRLERDHKDAEREQRNPRRSRWLFAANLSQLAAKFALGIIFIVFLETDLLYPRHFPADFNCLLKEGNDSGDLFTNGTQSKCISERATIKNFWISAVAVVNGIFAFFAFVEIVWILSRAKRGRNFMDNRQFYVDHLRSNSDPKHETPQEEEEIPLTNVESRCEPAVQEAVSNQDAPSSLNTGEAEDRMPLEHSELARDQLELTEAVKTK